MRKLERVWFGFHSIQKGLNYNAAALTPKLLFFYKQGGMDRTGKVNPTQKFYYLQSAGIFYKNV